MDDADVSVGTRVLVVGIDNRIIRSEDRGRGKMYCACDETKAWPDEQPAHVAATAASRVATVANATIRIAVPSISAVSMRSQTLTTSAPRRWLRGPRARRSPSPP